jgi:hypothetical protein
MRAFYERLGWHRLEENVERNGLTVLTLSRMTFAKASLRNLSGLL